MTTRVLCVSHHNPRRHASVFTTVTASTSSQPSRTPQTPLKILRTTATAITVTGISTADVSTKYNVCGTYKVDTDNMGYIDSNINKCTQTFVTNIDEKFDKSQFQNKSLNDEFLDKSKVTENNDTTKKSTLIESKQSIESIRSNIDLQTKYLTSMSGEVKIENELLLPKLNEEKIKIYNLDKNNGLLISLKSSKQDSIYNITNIPLNTPIINYNIGIQNESFTTGKDLFRSKDADIIQRLDVNEINNAMELKSIKGTYNGNIKNLEEVNLTEIEINKKNFDDSKLIKNLIVTNELPMNKITNIANIEDNSPNHISQVSDSFMYVRGSLEKSVNFKEIKASQNEDKSKRTNSSKLSDISPEILIINDTKSENLTSILKTELENQRKISNELTNKLLDCLNTHANKGQVEKDDNISFPSITNNLPKADSNKFSKEISRNENVSISKPLSKSIDRKINNKISKTHSSEGMSERHQSHKDGSIVYCSIDDGTKVNDSKSVSVEIKNGVMYMSVPLLEEKSSSIIFNDGGQICLDNYFDHNSDISSPTEKLVPINEENEDEIIKIKSFDDINISIRHTNDTKERPNSKIKNIISVQEFQESLKQEEILQSRNSKSEINFSKGNEKIVDKSQHYSTKTNSEPNHIGQIISRNSFNTLSDRHKLPSLQHINIIVEYNNQDADENNEYQQKYIENISQKEEEISKPSKSSLKNSKSQDSQRDYSRAKISERDDNNLLIKQSSKSSTYSKLENLSPSIKSFKDDNVHDSFRQSLIKSSSQNLSEKLSKNNNPSISSRVSINIENDKDSHATPSSQVKLSLERFNNERKLSYENSGTYLRHAESIRSQRSKDSTKYVDRCSSPKNAVIQGNIEDQKTVKSHTLNPTLLSKEENKKLLRHDDSEISRKLKNNRSEVFDINYQSREISEKISNKSINTKISSQKSPNNEEMKVYKNTANIQLNPSKTMQLQTEIGSDIQDEKQNKSTSPKLDQIKNSNSQDKATNTKKSSESEVDNKNFNTKREYNNNTGKDELESFIESLKKSINEDKLETNKETLNSQNDESRNTISAFKPISDQYPKSSKSLSLKVDHHHVKSNRELYMNHLEEKIASIRHIDPESENDTLKSSGHEIRNYKTIKHKRKCPLGRVEHILKEKVLEKEENSDKTGNTTIENNESHNITKSCQNNIFTNSSSESTTSSVLKATDLWMAHEDSAVNLFVPVNHKSGILKSLKIEFHNNDQETSRCDFATSFYAVDLQLSSSSGKTQKKQNQGEVITNIPNRGDEFLSYSIENNLFLSTNSESTATSDIFLYPNSNIDCNMELNNTCDTSRNIIYPTNYNTIKRTKADELDDSLRFKISILNTPSKITRCDSIELQKHRSTMKTVNSSSTLNQRDCCAKKSLNRIYEKNKKYFYNVSSFNKNIEIISPNKECIKETNNIIKEDVDDLCMNVSIAFSDYSSTSSKSQITYFNKEKCKQSIILEAIPVSPLKIHDTNDNTNDVSMKSNNIIQRSQMSCFAFL